MDNTRPPLVTVRNMTKIYQMGHGEVHALRGVDLIIEHGELVAIMGPSGSGKSTLMHLLGCLDTQSSGFYFLDGQDISKLNDKELSLLRSTKIGFVFQSFNLIPQFNVYENVEIPFLYHAHPKNEMNELILSSIERVGLSHRLHHLPTELSGGEMQRVAIARALSVNPLLILADEPTGNLDTVNSQAILQLFAQLNEQGTTLVIVTHDESVGASCKRIVRMSDGKVISDEKILKQLNN